MKGVFTDLQTLLLLGTIGLSLSGCSLPGQSQTFHLQDADMELGLGIHGEAGVKRIKVGLFTDLVSQIRVNH